MRSVKGGQCLGEGVAGVQKRRSANAGTKALEATSVYFHDPPARLFDDNSDPGRLGLSLPYPNHGARSTAAAPVPQLSVIRYRLEYSHRSIR